MSVAGKTIADYPLLLSEFDRSQNVGKRPSQVPAGSNKPVWWRCGAGHRFEKTPNGRTNNMRATGRVAGCPLCAKEHGGFDFWSWAHICEVAARVVTQEGHLPTAGWFQRNGYAMLVQCLYKRGKTWADLRDELDADDGGAFVESRAGIRWRSHPEASLSNYLWARGVAHSKGARYPDEYATTTGQAYGCYDLVLIDTHGRKIDVEVWGERPKGPARERYRRVRALKERFNAGRPGFLGIEFRDCFSDAKLDVILRPHIGLRAPTRTRMPHDAVLETTHWSNADELIETCRALASKMPDGKLPSEDWLRKRGRWAGREGPAYNTIAVYVRTWLGGTRVARKLLGQAEMNTVQWTRDGALEALREWIRVHGKTPGACSRDPDPDVRRQAKKLEHAVRKYVGPVADACVLIGGPKARKWSRRK